MKKVSLILLISFVLVLLTPGTGFADYDVKKTETIQKEFFFKGTSTKHLKIENIFGKIHLEGYNGKSVKISAVKTLAAKNDARLKKAQQDVKLKVENRNNTISIIVDGPFRNEEGHICWHDFGYTATYDFKVKVPQNTSIILRTINDGTIKVKNIHGDFKVNNVNGSITMDRILGSGSAHTVNGKVKVDFVDNPDSDCSFKTINGKVAVTFRSGLSADFRVKTFNGSIYSDFPSTYLPSMPGKGERKNGKYVYKSNGFQGVRIGKGGPAIKMDTLNGNIYIAKGE